jgi:hypothetical protein
MKLYKSFSKNLVVLEVGVFIILDYLTHHEYEE